MKPSTQRGLKNPRVQGLDKSFPIVLAEIRRMKANGSNAYIDQQTRRIETEISSTWKWEQRMVRLYGYGEIDDEFILRETQKAKTKRQELERERERMLLQKREMEQLEVAEGMAAEYCRRVRERLGQLQHEEKRLLLAALQAKVVVCPDRIEVQGAIPSYATIGRTSA